MGRNQIQGRHVEEIVFNRFLLFTISVLENEKPFELDKHGVDLWMGQTSAGCRCGTKIFIRENRCRQR